MLVSVTCIAWFSEDRPFAVGYFDGKLLLGTKEPLEKGGIVLIDAHKVITRWLLFLAFYYIVLLDTSFFKLFYISHLRFDILLLTKVFGPCICMGKSV